MQFIGYLVMVELRLKNNKKKTHLILMEISFLLPLSAFVDGKKCQKKISMLMAKTVK